MEHKYIACATVELHDDPLSPFKVLFEISEESGFPSEIQTRRFEKIRKDFAYLWSLSMDRLQEFFDENMDDRGSVRNSIQEAAITIHQSSEDETDDDFFWNIAVVVKENVPEQYWEVHFNGNVFQTVVIYP